MVTVLFDEVEISCSKGVKLLPGVCTVSKVAFWQLSLSCAEEMLIKRNSRLHVKRIDFIPHDFHQISSIVYEIQNNKGKAQDTPYVTERARFFTKKQFFYLDRVILYGACQ